MKQGLDDYAAKVNDVAGNIKSAMGNALQGMEDALVNFVMTGKLAFSDLARSILADITRIVIQRTIMKPFTGWLDSILPSANGNAFVNGEVQKYAYGGIVSKPTLFPMKNGAGLMGEAGAEAILPLKRGSDGRLGVTSEGSGGTIVNVSVNANSTSVEGDYDKSKQLGKVVAAAIQQQLILERRPGGLLHG